MKQKPEEKFAEYIESGDFEKDINLVKIINYLEKKLLTVELKDQTIYLQAIDYYTKQLIMKNVL